MTAPAKCSQAEGVLLPCPFCGGAAGYFASKEAVFRAEWTGHVYHCISCQARVQNTDRMTAQSMWNTRAVPDATGGRDADGYNGCYRQAIAALNYLAQYPRPVGGQSQFNAEHLLQIADEMKRSRSVSPVSSTVQQSPPVSDAVRQALEKIIGMAAKRKTDHEKCNCTVCEMRDVAETALQSVEQGASAIVSTSRKP